MSSHHGPEESSPDLLLVKCQINVPKTIASREIQHTHNLFIKKNPTELLKTPLLPPSLRIWKVDDGSKRVRGRV